MHIQYLLQEMRLGAADPDMLAVADTVMDNAGPVARRRQVTDLRA